MGLRGFQYQQKERESSLRQGGHLAAHAEGLGLARSDLKGLRPLPHLEALHRAHGLRLVAATDPGVNS